MREFELRMYFFVMYQLTGMQKGIQAGHAMGEYLLKYGRYNTQHEVWDFLDKWKTWIVLNGGVTNDKNFEIIDVPSVNNIITQLKDNDVEHSFFIEPDINDSITATCMIVEERVFNYDEFPDFKGYLFKKEIILPVSHTFKVFKGEHRASTEILIDRFPSWYKEWIIEMGGEKNVFLRELLKGKKFA